MIDTNQQQKRSKLRVLCKKVLNPIIFSKNLHFSEFMIFKDLNKAVHRTLFIENKKNVGRGSDVLNFLTSSQNLNFRNR